jgi:fibronectin-binding autotransporter adhesin
MKPRFSSNLRTTRLATSLFCSFTLTQAVHAQWTGTGAGGAGTDVNDTANWAGGTINGSFVNNTTAAIIALSADQSLGANGLTFFTANTTATTLSINGNGAGANEILTLGGNIIVNRASASSTAHTITFGSDLTLNLGSSVRQISGQGSPGSGGGTVNMGALVTGSGGLQLTGSTYGITLSLTNNSNDFTGAFSMDRGTLNFTSIADFGTASALGKGTSGTAITINNTTAAFTGTTDQMSNRTFNIGNTSGTLSNNSSNNSKLTLSGDFTNNVANGTMSFGGSSSGLSEVSGTISDGSFQTKIGKTGAGTWKLSGPNTFSGTTTISQGTLEISSIKNVNDTSASSLGKVTTAANGTISMGGSGGATLRYVGTGDSSDRLFQIGSAGSASSATIINNGTTGALVLSGGITSVNTAQNQQRSFILDGSNTNTNTFGGGIAFSFAPTSSVNGANAIITKNGTGLWILNGASSYSFTQFGGSGNAGILSTNVNGGTLRINHANAISGGIATTGGAGTLSINGGVLELTTASGNFTRDSGTTATNTNVQIVSGGFSAYGGNRSVNLGGASASRTWGANGFMTAGGGVFQLSSASSDSTLDFQNPLILGTTGTNTRTIQVNNGSAGVDAIMSGNLTSSGGTQNLTKTGDGTLSLTGTNSYNGITTVSTGTLLINGNQASATGNVTVSSAARLGGTGTVGGNTSIAGTAIHSPGNSVGKQTFDATGVANANLNYASTSIFEWELASVPAATTITDNVNYASNRGTAYDAVNVTGTLSGSDAIFRVVLQGTQEFTGGFWAENQTWSDIFRNGDGSDTSNLSFASIFSGGFQYYNYSGAGGTLASITTPTTGSFSITGSSLTWTAVPEPTGALASLLITAGLLRRRRIR